MFSVRWTNSTFHLTHGFGLSMQYAHQVAEDVDVKWYLGIYTAMVSCIALFYAVGYGVFILGYVKAGRRIHEKLSQSVLYVLSAVSLSIGEQC